MKHIIIAGPPRAGKSSLAKRLSEEFGYFVISIDKLVAVFGAAYPQLDIRLNWDRDKTTDNIAPFIGHFLGIFSSADGRGLLPYSHGAIPGNRFVLEGGYLDWDRISSVLDRYGYGISEWREQFLLIGLVQNKKTVDELVTDFKTYDTPDDWTYGMGDSDLKDVADDVLSSGKTMADSLTAQGFTVYDTSAAREQVWKRIIESIQSEPV